MQNKNSRIITVKISRKLTGIKAWRDADKRYRDQLRKLEGTLGTASDHKLAVVVHLYYTDMWPFFVEKLSRLDGINYDLFVTLPEQNVGFLKRIQNDFPDAKVLVCPNRGRDVLPFLKIARLLLTGNYEYLLKLHSKKSTHRVDGSEWLDEIIDNLLPYNKKTLNNIIKTLQQKDTGVIGPRGQYLQLTVNFEANGVDMTRIMNQVLKDEQRTYEILQTKRSDYGFFAGTMFWVRLDAVAPILEQNYSARRFPPEAGQIDGTFAHALERMFCLIPEAAQRNMFDVNADEVAKLDYKAGGIPDWSNVYIGPWE